MQTKEKLETKLFYLSNDLVFKHIFGTQENVKYVEDLLESFYNLERGTLKNLKVINSVKIIPMIIEEKKFEMDVLIELESGELINLEMYNTYDINAEKKSSLYISKVVATKSLKRGEKYELARKVSQLNFAKGDHVHSPKRLIKRYTIINEEDITDRIMPDLYQIYIIDVDVKDKFSYTNINERFKLWIELISCENEKELNHIAKKDKLIGEVVKKMKEFSEDEWVQDYESKERLIESQSKTATEKEIAKSLLNKKILTLEEIAEATNLTIEELEKLKKEIKEVSEDEWVQDYTSRDRLIESQHDTAMKKVQEEAEKKAKEREQEIVYALLEDNKDISYISKITKLSIEEIEELIKDMKDN